MLQPDVEAYYYCDTSLRTVDQHTHDYYEFLYFLSGDVTYTVAGQVFHPEQGDLVIVPPGTRHETKILSTDKPYKRYTLWISKAYFDDLIRKDSSFGYLNTPVMREQYYFQLDKSVAYTIQTRILNLIECLQYQRFGQNASKLIHTADILLSISRALYNIDHPQPVKNPEDLYTSLLNYINVHIQEDLSLDKLASLFYVSKYYISHLFKSRMGLSIYQYIIRKRLGIVQTSILAGTSIQKACEQAGFKNYSNFYRAFMREYGMSPKQYKETHEVHPQKPNRT